VHKTSRSEPAHDQSGTYLVTKPVAIQIKALSILWDNNSVRLLVILASPPLTAGDRTRSRLGSLPAILPCSTVTITNLCATPSLDFISLAKVAADPDGWIYARENIGKALAGCDEFMAAWGLSGLVGAARQHRSDQLRWLLRKANSFGHERAWTVGGQPRHPSRWHQYVSDVHGRTAGGTVTERLKRVVVRVPLGELV
jgi:hypothetical protein